MMEQGPSEKSKSYFNQLNRLQDGSALIHRAIVNADEKQLNCLLGFKVDINLQDKHGNTPLHLAVQTKQPKVVKKLIEAGAKGDVFNCEGLSIVDLAAANPSKKVLSTLKKHFPNLFEGVNELGYRPYAYLDEISFNNARYNSYFSIPTVLFDAPNEKKTRVKRRHSQPTPALLFQSKRHTPMHSRTHSAADSLASSKRLDITNVRKISKGIDQLLFDSGMEASKLSEKALKKKSLDQTLLYGLAFKDSAHGHMQEIQPYEMKRVALGILPHISFDEGFQCLIENFSRFNRAHKLTAVYLVKEFLMMNWMSDSLHSKYFQQHLTKWGKGFPNEKVFEELWLSLQDLLLQFQMLKKDNSYGPRKHTLPRRRATRHFDLFRVTDEIDNFAKGQDFARESFIQAFCSDLLHWDQKAFSKIPIQDFFDKKEDNVKFNQARQLQVRYQDLTNRVVSDLLRQDKEERVSVWTFYIDVLKRLVEPKEHGGGDPNLFFAIYCGFIHPDVDRLSKTKSALPEHYNKALDTFNQLADPSFNFLSLNQHFFEPSVPFLTRLLLEITFAHETPSVLDRALSYGTFHENIMHCQQKCFIDYQNTTQTNVVSWLEQTQKTIDAKGFEESSRRAQLSHHMSAYSVGDLIDYIQTHDDIDEDELDKIKQWHNVQVLQLKQDLEKNEDDDYSWEGDIKQASTTQDIMSAVSIAIMVEELSHWNLSESSDASLNSEHSTSLALNALKEHKQLHDLIEQNSASLVRKQPVNEGKALTPMMRLGEVKSSHSFISSKKSKKTMGYKKND